MKQRSCAQAANAQKAGTFEVRQATVGLNLTGPSPFCKITLASKETNRLLLRRSSPGGLTRWALLLITDTSGEAEAELASVTDGSERPPAGCLEAHPSHRVALAWAMQLRAQRALGRLRPS